MDAVVQHWKSEECADLTAAIDVALVEGSTRLLRGNVSYQLECVQSLAGRELTVAIREWLPAHAAADGRLVPERLQEHPELTSIVPVRNFGEWRAAVRHVLEEAVGLI
jgi:hypothetical protein